MPQIAEGKKIADLILQKLAKKIAKLSFKPLLAVAIVGEDKPSQTYVKMKGRAAESVGLDFLKLEFPADIPKENLILEIQKVQKKYKNLSGLIIQLPLPPKLQPFTREISNNINLEIDIDCLSHKALGQILMGENALIPPTPGAIMEILNYYKVDLAGKEVCLVGRGNLIGKPLAGMIMNSKATLVSCDKFTPDLSLYTKRADIIITGVGKKDLITGAMIKKGAIVIDAGVCFEKNKIYGDANIKSLMKKASLVTPTPGGVGPITVAKLLENTVKAAENKK